MKIVIMLLFFVSTSCVQNNKKHADSNKLMVKKITSDDLIDTNSSKIPSLMDQSNSIGLLQPFEIDLADRCFPKPQCDSSAKFRTIDGGCNNLLFPVWGQAHTASIRIIQANYSDGISQPRKAKSGRDLPNARHVRRTLFQDVDKQNPKSSLLLMQFGQIVAHDTELTLTKTLSDGSPLACCNQDGSTPKILPKGCLSIQIPQDDLTASKKRCFSSPRAMDTSDLGCQIKPVRQQLGVTSFIDASFLYGSDNTISNSLRTFVNGKLRSQVGPNGKSYLPNVKNATKLCNVVKDNTVCYISGDLRVNQHPEIAVQTISFLRLHNLLCDKLKAINSLWNDERIYQEARKLLIGMYQQVTYNEFLPILIGRDFARENNLLPLTQGFNSNYDKFLNPTTITSFTAAAYRSLHSLIQGFLNLVDENRKITSKIRLSDFFLKTDIVQRNDNYDSLTRGLLTQHMQEQDQFFTEEVSEFLFKVPNKTDGFDLISLDLERGRDFGVPAYNEFRQLCGLTKAETFDNLINEISQKNIAALIKLYEHVDDVDYYAAGLLEKKKPGAILGHTFQCIVGEMFFRWKFGDRFFYEFGDQPGSFTSDQLEEIRKTTLSLIVCMTSNINSVQRNSFEVPSLRNPLIPCNSVPKLNLAAWKET